MDVDVKNHLVFFLCIDYTIWPGWNHRGVYVLSRHTKLQDNLTHILNNSFDHGYPKTAPVHNPIVPFSVVDPHHPDADRDPHQAIGEQFL